MAIVCLVGETLRSDAALFGRAVTALGRIPLRLVSQAASRRNITFVLRDADVPEAMRRLHERTSTWNQLPPKMQVGFLPERRIDAIVLVGYGKMGRLVAELAPQYGCEVAGVIDPHSPSHGGGPDAPKWTDVDVAVDFSAPDAVDAECPSRSPGAESISSSGRRAGRHERSAVRRRPPLRAWAWSSRRIFRRVSFCSRRSSRTRRRCWPGRRTLAPSFTRLITPRKRTRRPERRCS